MSLEIPLTKMPLIDLHMHSCASDGQYTPEALVLLAKRQGISTMALTDHDTTSGVLEAQRTALSEGIDFVPGIELSAYTSQDTEAHILGHFIDVQSPKLEEFQRNMKAERVARMTKMVAKMNALGVDVTYQEVAQFSGGESIGRTHLARALMARGVVRNMDNAFLRFLGEGKPAHVPREKLTADRAIEFIHAIGGTVTLAHSLASGVQLHEIRRLRDIGLDGLEVWHPRHSSEQRDVLVKLAEELGLVTTAGSDFHGEKITPQRPFGCVTTPVISLEKLRSISRRHTEELTNTRC